ncbi:MAG: hypothetical protein J6A89_08700 [Clostridia bacterium]|nr:hypothetical protein [Clostridia bacterium]
MENTYTLSTQVLYRSFENGYMTCDITISKPYTRKVNGEIIRHPATRICGVKLKVENNVELLEKVKSLRKNTLLWITYTTDMPLRDVPDNMVIIKVLTQKEYDTLAEPYKKLQKIMWRNIMKKL